MTRITLARLTGVSSVLVLAAAIFFFGLLPGIVEKSLNRRLSRPLPAIPEEARALHADLFIADLHADSLLWNRNLNRRSRRGHVDLPRLEHGNVALQVFSSVIKTPRGQNYLSNSGETDALKPLLIAQLWPPGTWTSLEARARYQASRLDSAAAASGGRLRILGSAADLERFMISRDIGSASVAGLLAIEGLQALEGDLDAVDRLFDAGYRMMGLTHFYDNRVAGSAHGIDKSGLTPFGRDVVARLEDRGILVDLAHASPAAFREVLTLVTRPVVVSHTGVRATCPGDRNLTDEQLRGVAGTGGLVGIGYWPGAVCGTAPHDVVAAIRHVGDVVGLRYVALGSDYDGAVEVGFDSSQLAHLTAALLAAGFTPDEVRAVMGGNVLDLLRTTLPG